MQAFPTADWDALILKHVLPQLGSTLRESFVVNPRQQDLKPLEDVVAWSPLIRSSMMSQLIEVGFFPKWMDALYLWLTSEPNLEQVAEWSVVSHRLREIPEGRLSTLQVLMVEELVPGRGRWTVWRGTWVP